MSNLSHHTIKIKPVLNGWIVKAGCKKAVFTDPEEMADYVARFLADRAGFVKWARENMLHGGMHLFDLQMAQVLNWTSTPFSDSADALASAGIGSLKDRDNVEFTTEAVMDENGKPRNLWRQVDISEGGNTELITNVEAIIDADGQWWTEGSKSSEEEE